MKSRFYLKKCGVLFLLVVLLLGMFPSPTQVHAMQENRSEHAVEAKEKVGGQQSNIQTVADLLKLVEEFQKSGEFANSTTARSLQVHLTAVVRYEQTGATDKVVKHLTSFKELLAKLHNSKLISDEAFTDLTALTDDLLNQDNPEEGVFDTKPAIQSLKRLIPDHYQQVEFLAVPQDEDGNDYFKLTGTPGKIQIQGTSPAVLLTGFNWYLKYTANGNINWNGEQLHLPKTLPAPEAELKKTANVPHRFALNDTDDGYTGAYRNWEEWERTIDVLALQGVNEVLVTVGQEAVYYDTFKQFGYSSEEMLNWIPQPSHQPWWLLQNMSSFGGPVTEELIDARAQLGKKIADRLRELGMTPVFPGYFGTVPLDFVDKNPQGRVIPQGDWISGFVRPDWLDPRNELFPQVAETFYEKQAQRFGKTTMFKMDLLHEGGRPGDVPIPAAAKAVESALQQAHPGAIWTILGWQNNPSKQLISSLDKDKILILDGLSDRYSDLNRESTWPDTPYAFGSIWNFGGHTTMGANMSVWNEKYWEWKNKTGSNLSGIALMPEGSNNNPVAFDFLTEMAWQDGPVDMDSWFAKWSERRYGQVDKHAQAAWKTLQDTAYNMPADGWSEAHDGLFGAQPSLSVDTAALWSPASERYNTQQFNQALSELLQVAPELRDSSAYRYDLMDVTRQVLSNQSRVLLPKIKEAYDAKDKALFTSYTTKWLEWMKLMDEVVSTNDQMLLGTWLKQAQSWASDKEEAAKYEYDARSLITVWGHAQPSRGGLHDYANREWGGLVESFYYDRWNTYFTELSNALDENRQPQQIDWYAMGDEWARSQNDYPTTPVGDIHEISEDVLNNLSTFGFPLTSEVSASSGAIAKGETVTVTLTLMNDNSFSTVEDINLALHSATGFNVKPLGDTTSTSLAPGELMSVQYGITLSDEEAQYKLVEMLTAEATYRIGDESQSSTSEVKLMTANAVGAEFKTVSFNDSTFGQSGNLFGIYGGGADLWGGTNEFGSIYREEEMKDGTTVITRVVSQDDTWAWARAGIMVRNDMTQYGSTGTVNLALTPGNGCVLSWDSNNDGYFDNFSQKDFSGPVYLKLTKNGKTFTGSCSQDGETWTTVGTATISSTEATQDVGLFMTATNVVSGKKGLVEFDGFAVRR
ncbi:alpha-N-acetylglucosaminidase TIM-barrel domain-containing protein [Sporosarcina sp. NPDC096371]|uniref:alpha-N-acetylglucosaminidase n=1 Tax=Sporosarcina sp. NPDC096371 TaxID=3364530 RepID=UPI00381FEDC3